MAKGSVDIKGAVEEIESFVKIEGRGESGEEDGQIKFESEKSGLLSHHHVEVVIEDPTATRDLRLKSPHSTSLVPSFP